MPTQSDGANSSANTNCSKVMAFLGMRSVALFLLAAFLAACPAVAQATGDTKADQQKAEANKSEAAHIAEVGRELPGPAGYPECVHTGELTITLWMKNDMDTAARHLAVYDRFGCPGAHLRASFRCLLRFGMPNQKENATFEQRVRDCWLTPEMTPPAPAQAAPAAAAAPPAATPGTGAH
jgi:hypothetical protein